jgi:hypothetical protein
MQALKPLRPKRYVQLIVMMDPNVGEQERIPEPVRLGQSPAKVHPSEIKTNPERLKMELFYAAGWAVQAERPRGRASRAESWSRGP